MSLPDVLIRACRQGTLGVLWGALPFPLAAASPANRALLLNHWLAEATNLSGPAVSLSRLPPVPLLSLDPTDRVEQGFTRSQISLQVIRTRRDVPAWGQHVLLKLAGDLETRHGVVLSREEIRELPNDPHKRHLLAEARRLINDGVLLLLGCDPTNEDFRAWWPLLVASLVNVSFFALGEPSAAWPEGVGCLEVDFETLNTALWAAQPEKETAEPVKPVKGALMSDQADLKKLIADHQRRLQKRKEQEAKLGLNTPPEILIEIEDIEAKIEQLQAELAALENSEAVDASKPAVASQPVSPAPGATYNIHIQHASGLAIGDQAQVTQGHREPNLAAGEGPQMARAVTDRAQRCLDLAENIGETLELIKQYETQRRLADDPKTKRRAEREIADLREQLTGYETEIQVLGCD